MVDQLVGGVVRISGELTVLGLGDTVPHRVIAVKPPRTCRDRQPIPGGRAGPIPNYSLPVNSRSLLPLIFTKLPLRSLFLL